MVHSALLRVFLNRRSMGVGLRKGKGCAILTDGDPDW
jgi:hypothetical protein